MTAIRRIAHIDMDAFFASVELLRYPQLRGKPVVVGGRRVPQPEIDTHGQHSFGRLGDYVGRGVVTTATYEARALGVFSGMGLMHSSRLAPDAILLPADFEAYKDYSRRFKQAVLGVVSQIEDRGIDEIYADLTEMDGSSQLIAQRIKQAIREATGLSCSIGISPNKLLSKICSDLDKPDGVTVLTSADIPARIWPLPVSKVNGIGPKATQKLKELGIETIGELAQRSNRELQQSFGIQYGQWLYEASHGIDERALQTSREPKSLSRETTFERNLHVKGDRAQLTMIVNQLCERVAQDLLSKHLACRTVGVKVKFADFTVITRDISVQHPIHLAQELRLAVTDCLRRIRWDQHIRLLGVRASGLSGQQELFTEQQQLILW